MATSNDVEKGGWVDDRLSALQTPAGLPTDGARAHARLDERRRRALTTTRRRRAAGALAAVALGLLALPGPRAAAQRLWNQLTIARVEVVAVDRKAVPDDIAAVFAMQPQPFEERSVSSVEEATRIAGFRPLLPPPGVVGGTPTLSVVESVIFSTASLSVAQIERTLAAAKIFDITVPREWEGTTLVAHGGPFVVAEYPDLELIQAAPFRMTTPAAFELGRFMETAFRVFGREASEARTLGQQFAANPALVMHFPEHGPVRDVSIRSGRGLLVGEPGQSDEVCFFWNTKDRIYIIAADQISAERAAGVANSLE
jgi:hypothetical protein